MIDWLVDPDTHPPAPIFQKSLKGFAFVAFRAREHRRDLTVNVTATGLTTGARFQLGEVEYFNVPEPGAAFLGLAGIVLVSWRRRR
jgi:hypothetical protein